MEELTVSYKYTKQDIINFVLDSYSFEKVRCTLLLIFNITAFVTGIIFLFMHQINLGLFFIGISLIVLPIMLYASITTAQKTLSQISDVVCTLKEDCLSFMTNIGDNIIQYHDICDIKVTEELIFVYVGKNSALIIPKRAFKSVDKALDFASLLISKHNQAKLNRI